MKKYTKKTIEFYNKHSTIYIKSGAIVLKHKINRFIELLKGKKILDVGCGPGHDTDYLTKKGFDCLGIDLSKNMIDFARKNVQGKFKLMDFLNLKFKENNFDGIWCSSVIIHVAKNDLPKLLKNFVRVLKENGVLGIITPAKQKRTEKKNDTRIFTMFHKKELEDYLKIVGFEIIQSQIFYFGKKKWIFIISKKSL